ncbi:hypothetical protein B0H14DRAFT_2358036, partial [Mycena olivaceomarginata]
PAPSPAFVIPTAALVCNALWFISLGLSLSCALIATLVQQWSREFLHRTDMRSSPILRARIFSYLYYGLKRFDMHLVVGTIPLLLHISLLFFFAGLVAFLLPINGLIMIISAATLGLVALIYGTFTVLPLYCLDCPYRTPISGALWRVLFLCPNASFRATKYRSLRQDHGGRCISECHVPVDISRSP